MRKILMAAMAAAALGGTVAASPALAGQQSYGVSGFDSVSAIGPHTIVIRVGPSASVRADGPQESLDLMKVEVANGELRIVPRREHWKWGEWDDWRDVEPATYYVTVPSLEAAAIVGSGDMTIDRVGGDRFSASIAGSAELEIADLSAEDVRFSVAGSGELTARGTVRRSRISVAGSGTVHGRGLTSETASVSIAGSGDVTLTVKDSAHVSTVGSGDVDIAGGARCTVSAVGGGQTRCNGSVVEDDRGWARWGMWSAPSAPRAPQWSWGRWDGWNERRDRKHRDID